MEEKTLESGKSEKLRGIWIEGPVIALPHDRAMRFVHRKIYGKIVFGPAT